MKEKILNDVKEYFKNVHQKKLEQDFIPSKTRINYAGRVYDEKELEYLVDSALDFWLTASKYSLKFEKELSKFLGVKHSFLVNSGSSANLLAFFALTSPLLKDRAIKRGDEVITVAAAFPTTINPIIQYGAIPVFVDMDLKYMNINVNELEKAKSSKTKAVMLAHSLGNPFNLKIVKEFCDKYKLWLIEDNCDALGSTYDGKFTGTFGDIGTSSFYPAHHITMGEGGAVYTNDDLLKKIILSMRDWGRDCWCIGGKDNTCGCRFTQQFGSLPKGYDHKYVYSHFGFNLKATEMQAAIGCAQLEKLPSFIKKRKENYQRLYEGLKDVKEFDLPEKEQNSDPSWFGFMLLVNEKAKFSRNEISTFLEKYNIQTRTLFAGNIIRHPAFDCMKEGLDFKAIGKLENTEKIMNNGFWVGVYPGMSFEMIDYIILKIKEFCEVNK